MDLVRVVELEVDVLDYECPDIIAESVRVKVTLQRQRLVYALHAIATRRAHLEC